MAKFLFVYRGPAEQEAAPPSPEQMQAILAAWGQWIETVAKSGHLVDGGDGLLPTGKVVKAGGIVSDGPFIESKDVVGGYSILQADTYDKAVEFAKTCPAVTHGGTVEVRELAGFN
ncbi:MAG: YciI family protein [Gemmataceae bacterium]